MFGEFVRSQMSHFKYHEMNKNMKQKLKAELIHNTIEYLREKGRFLIEDKRQKCYRVVKDEEVLSKAQSWFDLKRDKVQLIGSFVYPEFLDCNPGLDEKIITFLDELYLSEFRKPWTPGEGICISADAPYNCNHQMSIHRKSYIRQNYSKEDVTIKTATDRNTFRWTYGTGSGRITHGIPKW